MAYFHPSLTLSRRVRHSQLIHLKSSVLKSNVEVQLRVAGKREVKTKAQKPATKLWTRTPVENLVIVGTSGERDIDMVLVARQQRGISPQEGPLVQKRFKAWMVPGNLNG